MCMSGIGGHGRVLRKSSLSRRTPCMMQSGESFPQERDDAHLRGGGMPSIRTAATTMTIRYHSSSSTRKHESQKEIGQREHLFVTPRTTPSRASQKRSIRQTYTLVRQPHSENSCGTLFEVRDTQGVSTAAVLAQCRRRDAQVFVCSPGVVVNQREPRKRNLRHTAHPGAPAAAPNIFETKKRLHTTSGQDDAATSTAPRGGRAKK